MASLRTFLFLLPLPLLLPVVGGDPVPASPRPATKPVLPPAADFEPYREKIPGSDVQFAMAPVRGGRFTMGSPAGEPGRADHEGPPVEVVVESFWMGVHEVTWAEFDRWNTDDKRPQSKQPDGVSRPTPPYMDMTFNMGRDGYPAICMSHVAARQYCKWLSEQTGRFYRLPTEAEWEHACRAGSAAVRYGELDDIAWHRGNAGGSIHDVATRTPNAWGLHDTIGNVWEWCWDVFDPKVYGPYRVFRGGGWNDPPRGCRASCRRKSHPTFRIDDLGFRLARSR